MAITSIIKYEGDNNTFVWKHPTEDFNKMTQLIVHESQEAVFVMNGMIADTFGPGKYNLDTESLPIIGRMTDLLIYGDASFHAEVYFINKEVHMALNWGTPEKVRFIEPNTGIPLDLGASGKMSLQVNDPKKLLLKLVGTASGVVWNREGTALVKSLQDYFRPLMTSTIKTNLANAIKQKHINIIEIDEYLEPLAEMLKEKIAPGFEEYGLNVVDFYVTHVILPEEDRNFQRIKSLMADSYLGVKESELEATLTAARRAVELEQQQTLTAKKQMEIQRDILDTQAEAQKTNIMAEAEANAARVTGLAEAEVMRAQGYDKKDLLQADVQKAFAEGLGKSGSNGGSGSSIASDMMQMQMGMMAAGSLSSQMKDIMGGNVGASQPNYVVCPGCGEKIPAGSKFCNNCGYRLDEKTDDGIICPHCGKKTTKGRFCSECGQPLQKTCPKCGAELDANAKFCPNCGEKIQ